MTYDNTLEFDDNYFNIHDGCRLPHDSIMDDADKLASLSSPVVHKTIALIEAEESFQSAVQAFENLHMAFMHNNSQQFQPMLIDSLVKARLRMNNAYDALRMLGGEITCVIDNPYEPYNVPTPTWNRRMMTKRI